MINWLHISDLHLYNLKHSDTKLRESLREKLIDISMNKEIKYIFITGDIFNQGKNSDKSLKLINDIRKILKIEKKDIFMVPGNHDLIRPNDNGTIIDKTKAIINNANPMLFVNDNMTDESFETYLKQQQCYFDLYKDYFEEEVKSNFHYSIETEYFNIVHLNTSWMCHIGSDKEYGKILINSKALDQLAKEINMGKPTIALGHHSFDMLNKDERKIVQDTLIKYNCFLYLCGHSHDAKVKDYSNGIIEYMTGTLKSNNHNKPIFCIGSFDGKKSYFDYQEFIYPDNWKNFDVMKEEICHGGKGENICELNLDNRLEFKYKEIDKDEIKSFRNELDKYGDSDDAFDKVIVDVRNFIERQYNIDDFSYFATAYMFSLYNEYFYQSHQSDRLEENINEHFVNIFNNGVIEPIELLDFFVDNLLNVFTIHEFEMSGYDKDSIDVLVKSTAKKKIYNSQYISETFLSILNFLVIENYGNIKQKIRLNSVFMERIIIEDLSEVAYRLNTSDDFNIITELEIYENIVNIFNDPNIKNIQLVSPDKTLRNYLYYALIHDSRYGNLDETIETISNGILYIPNLYEDGLELLKKQINILKEMYVENITVENIDQILEKLSSKVSNLRVFIDAPVSHKIVENLLSIQTCNKINYIFLVPKRLDIVSFETINLHTPLFSDVYNDESAITDQIDKYFNEMNDFKVLSDFVGFIDGKELNIEIFEEFRTAYDKENSLILEDNDRRELDMYVNDVELDLIMFTTFVPKEYVTIENIQEYLHINELTIKKPQLNRKLSNMSNILQCANSINLVNPNIRAYIEKEMFSKMDWQSFYKKIIKWIGESQLSDRGITNINSKVLKRFNQNTLDDVIENYKQLLAILKQKSKSKLILNLAKVFNQNNIMELYDSYIEVAIELKELDAIYYFVKNEIMIEHENSKNDEYRELLKENSLNGHIKSMVLYSQMYLNNDEEFENYEKILHQAVSSGSTSAKITLARSIFKYGDDYALAVELLKEAIDDNYLYAKFVLGFEYVIEDHIKGKTEIGLRYMEEVSEEENFEEVNKLLGHLYLNESSYQSYEKGIKYLEIASSLDVFESSGLLGSMYLTGKNVDRNIQVGLDLLLKSIAQGDVKAMRCLGWEYFKGEYLNTDLTLSFKYFYQAYCSGDIDAKNFILDALLSGTYSTLEDCKDEIIKIINNEKELNQKARLYYLIALSNGEYYDENILQSKELFEKERDEFSVEMKIKYASRIITSVSSVDDIGYSLDIMKPFINQSRYAQKYYYAAIIQKQKNDDSNEKDIRALKNAEMNLTEIFNLDNDEFSKYVLSKLYINQDIDDKNVKLGIKYFYELVDTDESYYLEKFINILEKNLMSDELKILSEFMEESDSLFSKRTLFKLYLSKNDSVYNPDRAERLFEQYKDILDSELYYRYAKEILEKTHLSNDDQMGNNILDKSIKLGSKKGLYLRLSRFINQGDFSEVYEYLNTDNELSSQQKFKLYSKMINSTNCKEAASFGYSQIKKMSKETDKKSIVFIANQYIYGCLVKQDIDRGLSVLNRELQNGNDDAGIELAELYYEGIWVRKDYGKAIEYLDKINNNKNAYCEMLKGKIYSAKDNKFRSIGKAKKFYRRASEKSDHNRFEVAVMMKNGIVFKMAERGIGLKYIDEFKNKMYSNEYLNFGMLAYCYGDKKLSKEFTLLAMNNSNSPDTKKPYSNLFYLCRRHDKMFNQDKYLSEELLKYIKKESNSIDIINLILYDYKNQINFSWKESISKIKKIVYPLYAIEWWGKMYMDSNDYDEKKEAALVIGLLIKCNKFKSLQFPLKWDEYINQADISIEDLNE